MGGTGVEVVRILDGKGFTEAEGVCTVMVNLEDETGTWMNLWGGKVAVDVVCVKDGKAGISFGHED